MGKNRVKTFSRKFIEKLYQIIVSGLNRAHHSDVDIRSYTSLTFWDLAISGISIKRTPSTYVQRGLCMALNPDRLGDKANKLNNKAQLSSYALIT